MMISYEGVTAHRGSLQRWSRVVLATGMTALAVAAATSPADAREAGTVTSEVQGSWYQPNPTCQLVLGCQELPLPSPYPAGTVHVGVLAGVEESRAFVAIDIPQGKKLDEGTLTLPVAPELSRAPDTARLRACLASGSFDPEDQGATATSPTPLCDFSSPVEVEVPDDPASALQVTMTVDLAPFITTWGGQPQGILAIVPVADVTVTDAWHVAFSTEDREDETLEFAPMSAEFVLGDAEEPDPDDDTDPTPDEPGDDTGGTDDGDTDVTGSGPVAPEGSLPPPAEPPASNAPEMSMPEPSQVPVAAGTPTAPVVAAGPMGLVGYRYPGVYAVPLLFALGLVWATRAFTADLTKAWR